MRHVLATVLLTACALGVSAGEALAPVPAPEPKPAPAAKPAALTVADLPEAVRTALEKQADGATIERIKAEDKGGVKSYSARWTKDNVRNEVRLAADGRLLKLKAERKGKDGVVAIDQLPEAVRTAITARLGDGKVAEVEQEDEKGKMVYSVEIARAVDVLELEISAEGTIIKEEVKPITEKKKGDTGEKGKKGDKGDKKDGEAVPAPVPGH